MLFGRPRRGIKRLLVVEDEPLVAFDNEHYLTDAGYEVVATVDGVAAALEVIAAEALDLILSDVSLSDGGNGADVARAAQGADVPVLFVTGNCPVEAQQLAVGCLAKPYNQKGLLSAIVAVETVLGGRPVRRVPAGLSLYIGPGGVRMAG